MKHRHNKKRNTAFLFEILIKELTRAIIKENSQDKKMILSLLKENFNKKSTLGKELQLYKSIIDSTNISKSVAEKIVSEVKKQHSLLNQKDVFRKQSAVIKKINKHLPKSIYNNYVPQYTKIASVSQYLNEGLNAKEKVFLEEKVVSFMTLDTSLAEDQNKFSTDKLVYKKFVENFNNLYAENLIEEQKELLSKYITSLDDNGLELKIFLNEEITRLKGALSSLTDSDTYDKKTKKKLNEVFTSMEEFKEKNIDTDMLGSMLKIQNLIHEASK